MTHQLWINLPVKDVTKSLAFFTQIGFEINTQYNNNVHSGCILVGTKKMVVMLFATPMFENISSNKATDTAQSNEVMFSFDAESTTEIDELALKVTTAGGTVFSAPAAHQGWMYGCAFTDLDGHRWNALYMDTSKMPTQ
jgi:uncharacterized protein